MKKGYHKLCFEYTNKDGEQSHDADEKLKREGPSQAG